jgi:glutamate/tyrosine decarboxylase-like PLP-dependent enzyme
MNHTSKTEATHKSLELSPEEFKHAGHGTINLIADFLEGLPRKKVTSGASPSKIRKILADRPLPSEGEDLHAIIEESANLLFDHSLFNGHPRFWGYITSSAAPVGALADLLASSVNANVGAFALSPMATEIERQTIRWITEMIGYHPDCGGVFVSGGNMANFIGFLAGRKCKIASDIRKEGLPQLNYSNASKPWGVYQEDGPTTEEKKKFLIYCPVGTHTWVQKAMDLFGFGTDAIRWVECSDTQQMDVADLRRQIQLDKRFGHRPFMVVGNAGSVGTGVVDDLDAIASICESEGLWFHVDGAYGVPAASLPELKEQFYGLSRADSIALDPHKWLYSPLEAGCILVRHEHHLQDAFSFNPDYYNFDGPEDEKLINFHEFGMQNSRGFRALKVWMSIRQIGRDGYVEMLRKDIALSKALFELVDNTPEVEAVTQHLSITTFRFVPGDNKKAPSDEYLNMLNELLLEHLQTGGEVFLSNAVVKGRYCLRVCIVNFRTRYEDLQALVEVVLREGHALHRELKNEN